MNNKYPVVKKHKFEEITILFTKPNHGVVIDVGEKYRGYYPKFLTSIDWPEIYFNLVESK